MDFETYKKKLKEEIERSRLSELQTKYNGIGTPDYANMSLRDELQTRCNNHLLHSRKSQILS